MIPAPAAQGRLIGVGVGPGDPELMTLKAHRVIASAAVVAYPSAAGSESRARRIAAAAIRPDALELPTPLPMRVDPEPGRAAYDAAAEAIAAHLEAGRDVAALCEGDPLFYGSFMYLADRLASRFAIDVVPGVTSIAAGAATARSPLCRRNGRLTVVPGPAEAEDGALAAALAAKGGVAVLKVGRHLPRLRAVIAAAGRLDDALYLAEIGSAAERVVPLAAAPETAPYFSMILIPEPAL